MTTGTGIFDCERLGDTLVVTPLANLCELNYQEIEWEGTHILGLLNDPSLKNVIVDLQCSDYTGSTALSVFVRWWKVINRRNGRFAFCNLSKHEKYILNVTRLDTRWLICESREAALRAVEE
jgi:anti-anti-sigma factor